MSIDTANQIINDQEEVIADLRNKILDAEDQRDFEKLKSLNLIDELKRIAVSENLWTAQDIARKAISNYR